MIKRSPILLVVIALLVAAASAEAAAPPASAGRPGWSVVPSPNASNNHNDLSGVSCVSSSFCMAVGTWFGDLNGSFALVESWDGSAWSMFDTSSIGSDAELRGVSCTSSNFCMAVGWQFQSSGTPALATFIAVWDGSGWSVVPSPNGDANLNSVNQLFSVSCTSPTFCVAVGTYNGATLIEAWDGTVWSVVPSPNGDINGFNALSGVSCISPLFCMSVGSYHDGTRSHTLTESWNGSAWTVASSPNRGTDSNELWGVSCTSPQFCVAVGDYRNGSIVQNLIETWIGAAWFVTPSPNAGTAENRLFGVSCPSATSCVAVGQYEMSTGTFGTLILSQNRLNWSVVSSPSPGTGGNWLSSVSCTSRPTFCMAAGGYWTTGGTDRTLFEVGP